MPTTEAELALLFKWDTCETAKEHAAFLRENTSSLSAEDAFQIACTDAELFSSRWQDLCDCLTESMQQMNPDGYWHAAVKNFGWRKQSGEIWFQAETGADLLRYILPKTECTFSIYLDGEKGFAINNAHHDSPTGDEWYHVEKAEPPI